LTRKVVGVFVRFFSFTWKRGERNGETVARGNFVWAGRLSSYAATWGVFVGFGEAEGRIRAYSAELEYLHSNFDVCNRQLTLSKDRGLVNTREAGATTDLADPRSQSGALAYNHAAKRLRYLLG
jgi:hypothetical protein